MLSKCKQKKLLWVAFALVLVIGVASQKRDSHANNTPQITDHVEIGANAGPDIDYIAYFKTTPRDPIQVVTFSSDIQPDANGTVLMAQN